MRLFILLALLANLNFHCTSKVKSPSTESNLNTESNQNSQVLQTKEVIHTPFVFQSFTYKSDKDFVDSLFIDFDQRKFPLVIDKVDAFVKKYPQSSYLNESLYLQGIAYENVAEWEKALTVYKLIVQNSLEGDKQSLGLALYRQSICYEAMGDKGKAVASLHDSLRWKGFLPLEVSEAQIPARLSSIFASLKQTTEADFYSHVAEKGVRKVKSLKKKGSADWLGETLFQMGSLPMDNLNFENYYEHLLSFSRHQKFLLQTLELADSKWSPLAHDLLINNYQIFWKMIKTNLDAKSDDKELEYVKGAETRSQMASQLLETLSILKSYESPKETDEAQRTAAIFDELKPLEDEVSNFLKDEILKKPWQKPIFEGSLRPQKIQNINDEFGFEEKPPAGVPTQLPAPPPHKEKNFKIP